MNSFGASSEVIEQTSQEVVAEMEADDNGGAVKAGKWEAGYRFLRLGAKSK